jgi:hypothetical protein
MNDQYDKELYRYTNLPSLIHILHTGKLTLLDPENWPDKNDSCFMRIYKRGESLGTLLALCLTKREETYHHWEVFAPGSSGVRIEFGKDNLLKNLDEFSKKLSEQETLRWGEVKYRTIESIRREPLLRNELPFTKRWPYEPESEFRLIYEGRGKEGTSPKKSLDVPIDLYCIKRIVLSGNLNKDIKKSVVAILRGMNQECEIKFTQTTLLENSQWSACGNKAVS